MIMDRLSSVVYPKISEHFLNFYVFSSWFPTPSEQVISIELEAVSLTFYCLIQKVDWQIT